MIAPVRMRLKFHFGKRNFQKSPHSIHLAYSKHANLSKSRFGPNKYGENRKLKLSPSTNQQQECKPCPTRPPSLTPAKQGCPQTITSKWDIGFFTDVGFHWDGRRNHEVWPHWAHSYPRRTVPIFSGHFWHVNAHANANAAQFWKLKKKKFRRWVSTRRAQCGWTFMLARLVIVPGKINELR